MDSMDSMDYMDENGQKLDNTVFCEDCTPLSTCIQKWFILKQSAILRLKNKRYKFLLNENKKKAKGEPFCLKKLSYKLI